MAKKPSFRDLYGRWSQQQAEADRRREEQTTNREQEALGIINAIEADGQVLSDDQKNAILNQFVRTGQLNTESLSSFVPVKEEAAPVLPDSRPIPQMKAITAEEGFDATETNPTQLVSDLGARFRAGAREGLAGLMTGVAPLINLSINSPGNKAIAKELGIELPQARTPAFVQEEANRLREDARYIRNTELSSRARVGDQMMADADGFTETLGLAARNPTAVADIVGEQAGQLYSSLPGAVVGPEGLVISQALSAGGSQGQQAYDQIIAEGGTESQAERARETAAGLSFAVNTVIPTLTPKGMALEQLLTGVSQRVASRSVTAAAVAPLAGETASEMLTEVLDQGALNFATGRPLTEGLGNAAAMGIIVGTAMGGGPAVRDAGEAIDARRTRSADNEANILANLPQLPEADPAPINDGRLTLNREPESIDRQLYNAEQDLRQDQEREDIRKSIDEALTKKEEADAQQRELEEEAGFRTIERDKNLPDSRVERYADVVERVPVNPPREITPEQVAQERLDSARVKEINEVARRREAVTKVANKKAEAAKKKADTASRAMRNKAIDELAAANPNATDAEIADMLPAKIAQMQAAPAPTAAKPKAKAAPKTDDDLSALKASADPLDRTVADAMSKLGLGMKGTQEGDTTGQDFAKKARTIGTALAKNSSRQAAAVEDLIRQGKLVIAPNAKSVGREEQGRVGEYDLSDGKMYVYADKLSDNPIADIIEAASHESGHVGTFNQRAGRDAVMTSLVGNEKVIAAAGKLRAAAKQGNKWAKEALAKAEADTAERGGDNTYENAELVSYFIGDVAKSRNTALGSVGGVVRDLVSGARSAVRDKLGMDVDISIGDLNTAASRVMEEAARTDTGKRDTDESLAMIYPKTAKGYEQALKDGRVYTSSQGNEQFVLSDADAKMKDGVADKLSKGTIMRLEEVMDHPVLFDNMPAARDILIARGEGMGKSMGQYNPGADFIELADSVIEGRSEASLRNVILHEAQHWVQDQSAAREGFLDDKRPATERAAVDRFDKARVANDAAAEAVLDNATDLASSLPTAADKRAAMNVAMDPNLPPHRKASELINLVDDAGTMPPNLEPVVQTFQASLDEYREAAKGLNAANRMQRQRYLRSPTEAEAFFTQANTNTTQENLPVNPELDEDYGTEAMATRGNDNRRSLGMAARQSEERGAVRNWRGLTLATSMLRNDKGLGRKVLEAAELAKSAPAVAESRANQAVGQFDRALEKMAAQQGTTYGALNKEIQDKLEELSTMKGTPSEYKAAFNAIADQYGAAGKYLKRLRQIADDLSMELVNTYIAQGGELSPNEAKELKAILSNIGRYTHRFYAARQPRGMGEQYSRAVMDSVENSRNGKKLKPAQEELLNKYEKASKVILDDITIPDETGIEELSVDKIDYLYDTWVSRKENGISTEDKVTKLLEVREDIGPERLKAQMEAIAESLLFGAEEAAASKYYRGGKQNTGILQSRKKIPKEIRDLLGEVTDPAAALLVTVSKQAELVARTKMLLELRDVASPQDLQPPGSEGNATVKANNMKPLDGDAYGPLEGWYASPSMRAMISDTREQLQNFTDSLSYGNEGYGDAWSKAWAGAGKLYMTGASTAKALSIVGNVFRYPLNFAGSTVMPLFNGNIDPRTYARGLKDAAQIIGYARNPSRGLNSAEDAVKYRVVDSATVGDLKLLDQGKLNKVINEMAGKSPGYLLTLAKQGLLTAREAYAMMDVWSKIANFHYETQHLTDLYKAAGIDKTEDQIKREASDIVSDTSIGWNRSLPLVKFLERGGITQFGAYLYDTYRIQLTNALQGVKEIYRAGEMPTPKAKALTAYRGTKRLAGQAAVWAAAYMVSKWAGQIWGDEDDEEDKRALLPDYARTGDFVNVGTDEDGKPVLFNISNIDPIGPVTDLMRAARISEDPIEAVWAKFKENYVKPSLGPLLFNAAARSTPLPEYLGIDDADLPNPRKPLLQEWFPSGYGAALSVTGNDKTVQAWNNVAEALTVPGTARAWTGSNGTPVLPASNSVGDKFSQNAYSVAKFFGARGLRYNPEVGAENAGRTYNTALKVGRDDLRSFLANRPDVTPEEMLGKVSELAVQEKKAWDEVARVYRGLTAVGVPQAEIETMFKERRLPVSVIEQVANEEFESRLVQKATIEAEAKKALSKKSGEEKKEEAARWQRVWEVLEQVEGVK